MIGMIVLRLVDLVVDSVDPVQVEQQEVQHNQAQTHFMEQLIMDLVVVLDLFQLHMLLVVVEVPVVQEKSPRVACAPAAATAAATAVAAAAAVATATVACGSAPPSPPPAQPSLPSG